MVFILHILVYAELLLCLIVTLSQNATTGFRESSCDRFVLFREGAKRKVSVTQFFVVAASRSYHFLKVNCKGFTSWSHMREQ